MRTHCQTIDTRWGSDNHPHYSRGNTLPYTGVPFGMNYFLPQTTHEQGAWFFNPNLPIFQGFRLTHQPSPWIGDYAWCLITPITGDIASSDLFRLQSSYSMKEAIFQPHYLRIFSERYQIQSELVPSCYGAIMRFRAPEKLTLCFHAAKELEDLSLTDQTCHFRILDQTHTSDTSYSFYLQWQFSQPIENVTHIDQDLFLTFSSNEVTVQLGTSYLSQDMAHSHLPNLSLEEAKKEAADQWNQLLKRIEVKDAGGRDQAFFDHCLYRLLLFPQTFYETDFTGNDWHLDVTHNEIKPGKAYTNIGFWDLFRTSFPLFNLVYPDYYRHFLEGFLNTYQDTGFLPKWLAPDERGMMPGTLIDGVFADAVTKGIAPDLHENMLTAMLQTAQKTDPTQHFGRHGNESYKVLGYLPDDFHESVSHSLDYAYSDFCIATVAKQLGHTETAAHYAASSLSYRTLYDAQTGFMRARSTNGTFKEPFSPTSWGGDYAECSATQATFGALHDLSGLIELMGGKKAFTQRLLDLANQKPQFDVRGYGYEIHEMSEMAQAPFGQIAISNQPSFHIPYLFRHSLHPEYTNLLIHQIRSQAFHQDFQAYPGDEDNGSLSAWYLWSALGLYPTCPGKPIYDLGLPLFKEVLLHLPKQELKICANSHTAGAYFIQKALLDGKEKQEVSHQDLLEAQLLQFELSWLPPHA